MVVVKREGCARERGCEMEGRVTLDEVRWKAVIRLDGVVEALAMIEHFRGGSYVLKVAVFAMVNRSRRLESWCKL